METYTKVSEEKLKVTKTDTIDGISIKNESLENKADIEKQIRETEEALKIHDARREEFVNRLEFLNTKMEHFSK